MAPKPKSVTTEKSGAGDSKANSKDSKNKKAKGKKKKALQSQPETPQNEEEEASVAQGRVETPEEANTRLGLPPGEAPCSTFFQQMRTMDFQSYLRLKREEKSAEVQYKAARLIQTAYRGFITRFKMRILHKAATKMQAVIRGFVARRKVGRLVQKRADIRHLEKQNQAATKIQAAWKGYYSRKKKLNFKEYKKIQKKNAALKKSIESINKLESTLVNGKSSSKHSTTGTSDDSSTDVDRRRDSSGLKKGKKQKKKDQDHLSTSKVDATNKRASQSGGSATSDEIQQFLQDNFSDLGNMSNSRISELYSYAKAAIKTGREAKAKKKEWKRGSRAIPKSKSAQRIDSWDDLFPDFPEIEGLIKPDPAKVEALKQAIRLLQQQMESKEEKNLQKLHYLLRTVAQPGVYSDPYCTELTEFEKQLKSVKYYTPPADPRIKKQQYDQFDDDEEEGSLLKASAYSLLELEEEEEEQEEAEEGEDETVEEESDETLGFPQQKGRIVT